MKLTEEQLKNIIYEETVACLNERGVINEGAISWAINGLKYGKLALRTKMMAKIALKARIKQEKAGKLAVLIASKMGVTDKKILKQLAIAARRSAMTGGFTTFGRIASIIWKVCKIAAPIGLIIWAYTKFKNINSQDALQYTSQNIASTDEYMANMLNGGNQKQPTIKYPTAPEITQRQTINASPKQNNVNVNQQGWNHKFPKEIQ